MKRYTWFLLALTATVAFLMGIVAAGTHPAGSANTGLARPVRQDASPLTVSTTPTPAVSPGVGIDFSVVASRLNGAVVNIDAATRGAERPSGSPRRFSRDPDDGAAPREGSGSGFIIDRAGYILTNEHVIEGADRITVTLGDGRAFRAVVVGSDPAIDVALLHISANGNLPVAPLGDSEALRVGEWVCAIGNPLGYVHSVTVGVVSFIGRKLFDASLDAFIQTDAAISFGNSGGPLINSRGQVVAITTAISSQAPNIGFAIPIGQVMAVLGQLKESGRVSRGYIGVDLTDATPELRSSLHLGPPRGALIQDVVADTPADRAGLRVYDLITSADGRAIDSHDELVRYISAMAPGSVSRLTIWRDGTQRTVPVRLTERPLPARSARLNSTNRAVKPVANDDLAPLGLKVKELDPATIRRVNLPDSVVGVWITDVDPAGPARLVGVRSSQILLEINRRRVASVADFRAIVSSLRPGESVALFIYYPYTDQRVIHAFTLDPQ